jgi:uncharacterized protein (TIGR02145 family)
MKKKVPLLFLVCLVIGITIFDSCKKDPVIPTLTTNSVINITINSATSGGTVSIDGGASVTARGLCWSTTANPTIGGSHTTNDKGIGSFVSNLTDLLPNTLYHLRAYASNSVGTAYGNDVSFTTTPIVVPTLTTADVSSIALTTAVSGGNITADGNADVTAKGICWSLVTAPTISDSKTTDGTGTGSFISNLTGLTPATTYYVRAYATNVAGIAYGNEVSFTTSPVAVPTLTTNAATSITLTTAISGGNITADGGGSISARGICWATVANPTISGSKTTDGTGIGSFISNLTVLLPGTTYHIRAYATNSAGTAYGNDVSFATTPIGAATLTTSAITSITLTTAVSGGNVITDGGGSITARGICWSTTASPTTGSSKTSDGTGTGSFTSNLTGLTPATTYYVRAYATNSAGTAYGNEVSFTTSQIVVPTVTTTAITSITSTTAVSGGNVLTNGGASITGKGVCWSTTANPTLSNSSTSDGTGTGSYVSNLTGLQPSTTYHVRAYAANSAGTAYGSDLTFTTTAALATLTTTTVTSITQITAVSGGSITSNGGGTITTSGICWATTANPTTTGSKTTDGTTTGTFISNLTGLTSGTLYHVRAYATNSAGTGYGNDLSFTTNPATLAILTTATVTSIGLTTAVSGGNITSDGNGSITDRGVCWATTATPTISNYKISSGTGTGSFASNLSGLLVGTTYYVRAYATNSAGTAYGNQFSFNTKIADVDGNTYNIVTIGSQVWMAENLKTTLYNNSSAITNVTDGTAWTTLVTPAYCWFNNDLANKTLYGALYNWFTLDAASNGSKNVCPTGWHVPTDAEFQTLESYLGMAPADLDVWGFRGTNQGTQMKNTTGWNTGENGTNTSGFSALAGGYRYGASGAFNDIGNLSYWWSSTAVDATTAWYRRLDGVLPDVPTNAQVYRAGVLYQGGKYVRCVKN